MRILSISRNESRKERGLFFHEKYKTEEWLCSWQTHGERVRKERHLYSRIGISYPYIKAAIYIYIHGGALTCSPPGGSTNVVNRYWYWRVIFARRRRFPRLYQAWPNASGLLYHGQTIAILFAVAKDVKMDIKMRAIEGERVLAIDRKFFHGWCTCPAVDYRGMGGRERKFGNEFLIVSIVRNSPFICLAWKLLPWDETKVCFYLLPFKSRIWRAFGLEIMEIWFFICIYKMLLNFTIFCVIFFFL